MTTIPYIQKATNNYFGFMPVSMYPGATLQVNPYLVSSSEGQINAGDVMVYTTIGTVRSATGTFASTMLGVSQNSLAANAGSTAATINSNTSQLMFLYDNPDQVFVAAVTSSFLMGSTSVGKNISILATGTASTVGSVSTAVGGGNYIRSIMALAGGTSTTAGTFKLIGLHPIEQGDFSTDAGGAGASASVRKWLVKPNIHFLAPGAAGVLVTT